MCSFVVLWVGGHNNNDQTNSQQSSTEPKQTATPRQKQHQVSIIHTSPATDKSNKQGSSDEPTTVEPPTKRTQRSPLTVFQEKIDAVKTEKQYKKTLGELESNKKVAERSDFALAYLIKLYGYDSVSVGNKELFRDVLYLLTLVKARLMKQTNLPLSQFLMNQIASGRVC